MKITINGSEFTREELNAWKMERIKAAHAVLGTNASIPDDVEEAMDQLTEIKLQYTEDEMMEKLDKIRKKMNRGSALLTRLSGKKHSCAIVEMEIDGIDAKTVAEYATLVPLNPEHLEAYKRANLRACPDHYMLRALPGGKLEILETTGTMAGPGSFLINYNTEKGLITPANPEFPYESMGNATDYNGRVIGGVRHQFKDTEYGTFARLCVEFPSMTPASVIKTHQKHMAMEFDYWVRYTKETVCKE